MLNACLTMYVCGVRGGGVRARVHVCVCVCVFVCVCVPHSEHRFPAPSFKGWRKPMLGVCMRACVRACAFVCICVRAYGCPDWETDLSLPSVAVYACSSVCCFVLVLQFCSCIILAHFKQLSNRLTTTVIDSWCFTSTEARWPIRDGDRVGRGRQSEGSTAETARKRPERPWTATRTMEVLRRCPLAIPSDLCTAQLLFQLLCLDRVTKTMFVAPLLINNLDNSQQKQSSFLSPAPPPYSWSLLG